MAAQQLRGNEGLFLPHQYFQQPPALPQLNVPLPYTITQFPWFDPPGLMPRDLSLHSNELRSAPVRTGYGVTTPATLVNNMYFDPNKRLTHIWRSNVLWDNLKKYAEGLPGRSPGVLVPPPVLNALQPVIPPVQLANGITTWTLVHVAGLPHPQVEHARLPPALSQADAMTRIAGWFTDQRMRSQIVTCSEPAVQDEVRGQLLNPLDRILKTRYCNRVAEPLRHDQALHGGWENAEGGLAGYPPNAFYPQWGRSCAAGHREPEAGRYKAGFPDFILSKSATYLDNGAVIEVKSWWSCHNELFDRIFSSVTAMPQTGVFSSGVSSASVFLVKQVWAELYFFSSTWGAWTNGNIVVVFVKTGNNDLTFSEPHDWSDPDVLIALAGLTFAAVDMESWEELRNTGILPAAPNVNSPILVDWICPPLSRLANWN